MNKIRISILACICSFFSFAQNIDTTRYQKVSPGDTIRNYYPQTNSNAGDTIKDYYPSGQGNNQPINPGRNRGNYPQRNPIGLKNQPTEPSPLMKKLYFGSYVYLTGYGTPSGAIISYELSPHVGYKFNDKLSAGLQILYTNSILTSGSNKVSYSIVGGGIFARYMPIKFLFVQVEYDFLTVPGNYPGSNIGINRSVSGEKIAGLGLRRSISDMVSYYIMLMYDINPDSNSPYNYNQLIYRIGFSYNF